MKTQTKTMRSFITALAVFVCAGVPAWAVTTPFYGTPGYNIFSLWQQPAEQIQIVKTNAEIALGVTTFSAFNPGFELNNLAGITILVGYPYEFYVNQLNSLNLKVGNSVLATYPAVFTDVFGICAPDTFGFACGTLIDGFGIVGSPILFALDVRAQDANRFFATPHGGMSYVSNSPDLNFVPDNGLTVSLFAVGLVILCLIRGRLDDVLV